MSMTRPLSSGAPAKPKPIAMPPADPTTVSELLGEHHRMLDEILDQVIQRAGAGQPGEAADLFAGFDRGLRRHIHAEEEILFPAFEDATGMAGGPTAVMRAEHEEIKDLLEEIGQLLAQSEGIAESVLRLRQVLGPHNGKEEEILYPMSDQALGNRLGGIVGQMARFLAEG